MFLDPFPARKGGTTDCPACEVYSSRRGFSVVIYPQYLEIIKLYFLKKI
jgi:hypothetical protein